MEKINIPEGITELSEDVFSNCAKLKDVTISNSVKIISQYAFFGTALETVLLPDSVTEVRRSAFASCPNLKRIEFSREIKSIGDYAVNNTGNLNTVIFKGDAPSLGKDVFILQRIRILLLKYREEPKAMIRNHGQTIKLCIQKV
ncbi:MAG: leucine-rich repeat domain-containing protein [Coprococcus sp.]